MLLCSKDQDESYSDYNDIDNNCQIPMVYDYSFGTISGKCSIPKGGRGFFRFDISSGQKFEIIYNKTQIRNKDQIIPSASGANFL